MFDLTKEDHAKIVEALSAIVSCSNKDKVFVNWYDLCQHLEVSRSNSDRLTAEISDILTYRGIVEKFGTWIVYPFDGQDYLFVRLFEVGTKCDIKSNVLNGTTAAYTFDPNWPNLKVRGKKDNTSENLYQYQAPEVPASPGVTSAE